MDYSSLNYNENQIEEYTTYKKIRARSITRNNVNMTIEIMCEDEGELISKLMDNDIALNASIVEYDGDITV